MPIVYVHGVSTRDEKGWELLEALLRRYIAPVISDEPDTVSIARSYWGDFGAKFRWNGVSAPTSPLRELRLRIKDAVHNPPESISAIKSEVHRLRGSTRAKLGQFAAGLLAHNINPDDVRKHLRQNLHEHVARGAHGAGNVMTRAVVEIRSPMSKFITMFVGDVLTYLSERGDAKSPGWIPSSFLASLMEARELQLQRGGEPIIVMSHSMGGQIVYDAVTHFLPLMDEYKDVRIDFWAAAASQVGLFEELKLFLESNDEYSMESDALVPFPSRAHLGHWWNVWDHNDFVSYSVRDIIDEVDDEHYSTGLGAVSAHGGYLELPSFFRKFAKKVELARTENFGASL